MSDEGSLKPSTLSQQAQEGAVSVKDGGRGGETGYMEGHVEGGDCVGGIIRDVKKTDDADQELRAGGEVAGDGGSNIERGSEGLNIFHDPQPSSAQLSVLVAGSKTLEQHVLPYKGNDAEKIKKLPAQTQEAEVQTAEAATEEKVTFQGKHIPQAAGDSQRSGERTYKTSSEYIRYSQQLFKVLKGIQFEIAQIKAEFHKEVHDIKRRYACLYQPLFDKRYEIVNALYEPTYSECYWGPGVSEVFLEEMKKAQLEETSEDQNCPGGVPLFWLVVFKNTNMLGSIIQQHDEPILEHLKDVRLKYSDAGEPMSFTVEFLFEPNEYFSNEVLSKTYIFRSGPDDSDPYLSRGLEIINCTGCQIHWKNGKNVTQQTIKQQKIRRSGTSRTVCRTTSNESFFNYFCTPEMPEFGMLSAVAREKLDENFKLGYLFHDHIILRPVLYFTGEGFED